jgi:hypothetical protein
MRIVLPIRAYRIEKYTKGKNYDSYTNVCFAFSCLIIFYIRNNALFLWLLTLSYCLSCFLILFPINAFKNYCHYGLVDNLWLKKDNRESLQVIALHGRVAQ